MQDWIKLLNRATGAVVILSAETLVIGVKIFGKSFRTFLFNICNCLRAKILKNALGSGFWVWHSQLQQEKNWLPSKVRYERGNLFILVNNIIAN